MTSTYYSFQCEYPNLTKMKRKENGRCILACCDINAMASIVVELDGSQLVVITKIKGGIKITEHLDVMINMDAILDREQQEYVLASIKRGNIPEFARFANIWHSQIIDVAHPFLDELIIEIDEQVEFFERLLYELWKTDSRLINGDHFVLSLTSTRCVNLGTSVAIIDNVDAMLDTLLVGR